jgi:hypothetical protein
MATGDNLWRRALPAATVAVATRFALRSVLPEYAVEFCVFFAMFLTLFWGSLAKAGQNEGTSKVGLVRLTAASAAGASVAAMLTWIAAVLWP